MRELVTWRHLSHVARFWISAQLAVSVMVRARFSGSNSAVECSFRSMAVARWSRFPEENKQTNDDRYRIAIDCADLQPGRSVWSDIFYIGKQQSGTLDLVGTVYAANLSTPTAFTLSLAVHVAKVKFSASDLIRLVTTLDDEQE